MGALWVRRRGSARLLVVGVLLFLLWGVRVASAGSDYTVQPGDTLYRIATRHGLTVAQLAEANHIVNPALIYAGQVLVIPDAGEAEETTTDDELAGDETANDEPGDTPSDEETAPVHVVQAGETLTRIAVRYGVSVAAIQQANQLSNANVIFPGQRLQIPGGDAAAAPSPAPPPATHKRIVVDKSEQRAYVYADGELLWTFVVSTGMPGSETWTGTFQVRSKIPNAYAQLWSLQMPYWLGFYHTGYLENGFHALPIMSNGAVLWDGYLGTPVSYGCVILSYPDAETLYNWAEIGTEVVVQP